LFQERHLRPIHPIIEQANAAFPNLEVELGDEQLNRSIISRRIGRYSVTHLKMPAIAVELIGQRAVAVGLGNHLKLMWQLTGRMRYEGSSRKFDITPGDLVVTSMAEDYRLEMLEGHEALILIFDPADDPRWPELARDALTTPIARQAGIMTAAGGVRALLSAPEDRTGEFAARTMIDLALLSTRQPSEDDSRRSPLLARAALHVLRNSSDGAYGPERLARDMGMSRRSLYMRLAAFGTTPGGLIRRTRLDRAREDILQDRTRSLLDIALANGFGDGASLSRAFRIAYGHPPSELRRED
jgi:AraC family transcriptional regulator, positive regulator of tynA and feaB